MGMKAFDAEPRQVEPIATEHRTIKTAIPHPESLAVLETLHEFEPESMGGQPPIVWDHASGFQVFDSYGNKWIDFSSGVLVANCGHSREEMKEALKDQLDHGALFTYCFPNHPRAALVKKMVKLAGGRITKCFLLTTGGEATENAIKLARTHGTRHHGSRKRVIVTFDGAFHGRTLGAQLAGGIPALKDWVHMHDTGFVNVPFPDAKTGEFATFADFLAALKWFNIGAEDVCGVMCESYQGGTARFYPVEYVKALRRWCDENDVLLIDDEVQAGFGRTGKWFTFQHYGVDPDIICCGKGLSGGLPISAVLGGDRVMSLYGPGEMTSTHAGHPLASRGALMSLELLEKEKLVENSAKMGKILHAELNKLLEEHPERIYQVNGKGLLAGILFRTLGNKPDNDMAMHVVDYCVHHGVMLYAPLGPGGGTVKINPPLLITEAALREGLAVFAEAVEHALQAGPYVIGSGKQVVASAR